MLSNPATSYLHLDLETGLETSWGEGTEMITAESPGPGKSEIHWLVIVLGDLSNVDLDVSLNAFRP